MFDTPALDVCDIGDLCVSEVNAHAKEKFLVPKSLEPHPADAHVGQRVAVPRKLLKPSQVGLANTIGYSRRLVQWYEPENVG